MPWRETARASPRCGSWSPSLPPALGRYIRGLPTVKTLLWAWCAADMVHFASVRILLSIFERQHVEQHAVQNLLVVLIESSFVLTLTAASD
jgi:hypothetical protein